MDFFPAFLDLRDKPCLIVGGGDVAARKAGLLLRADASLTVVSPALDPALATLRDAGKLRHVARLFEARDLDGQWLVVSATGNPDVEATVYGLAEERRVFCNAVDDRNNCSYITPSIVDRSPILIAISSAGTAPVLARRIRARIETMLPRALGSLAVLAGQWRGRVKVRFDSLRERMRLWERFFECYELVDDGTDAAAAWLESAVRGGAPPSPGEAWLVGAGPGDPELLTLKALQCMQSADVVLHDRLVSRSILDLARRDAEMMCVGKQAGGPGMTQAGINALLIELVLSGKRVCRLKGGDPFIFGRGGEEVEALRAAGLSCSVVPGITAAAGCAAAAGIPLTHRDAAQSVVFVTAHGRQSVDALDWPSLARDRQTLAVYMGVARIPELTRRLMQHGRAADTPVAIIEKGTTPDQRVLHGTLAQLPLLSAAHRLQSPAMLLIGEVAATGQRQQAATQDAAAIADVPRAVEMPRAASIQQSGT